MAEYLWANNSGEIITADYDRTTALNSEEIQFELKKAFKSLGKEIDISTVGDKVSEVYKVTIPTIDKAEEVYVAAKSTTPGGRNNLKNEQRIQQKAKYLNYAFERRASGEKAVSIGIYKKDDALIFCAWKLSRSHAASEDTPISKQIKIETIAKALTEGFVQQDKGSGEYACAFRKEFICFYVNNADWLHTGRISELAEHTAPESDSVEEKVNTINFTTALENDKPRNRIIFGAPGTGKSYTLNKECRALVGETNETDYERVTFHPDYSYAQFVGTYKPTMIETENNFTVGADEKDVLSILADKNKTAQEKYDKLYPQFREDGLTRLPVLLGLYTNENFKTLKKDGSEAVGDNSVEKNHGRAIRPYVNLISEKKAASEIAYEYVPGPFMRVLVKALKNSKTKSPKPFLLLIEEINRANVAAVFGDVFQLLDRGDNEVSEYPIQATEDIKKHLTKELGGNPSDYSKIRIPDNMFIWATMNSADQGVFPIDTAFKRRWDFTYLGIDDSEDGIKDKTVVLGSGEYKRIVEWNELRKAINTELLSYKINEDKLLGPYFIAKKNLSKGGTIDSDTFIRIFKNKVIMYLFDDAAKQKRSSLFGGCDEKSKSQYSKICAEFDIKGVSIFCETIRDKFTDIPGDDG